MAALLLLLFLVLVRLGLPCLFLWLEGFHDPPSCAYQLVFGLVQVLLSFLTVLGYQGLV
jgi:hypothetical protein